MSEPTVEVEAVATERRQRRNAATRTPEQQRQHDARVLRESAARERAIAYLNGDHSIVVGQRFAEIAKSIGKRSIDLRGLTNPEKYALAGVDLRWERGPDGALLWVPPVLENTKPDSLPTFSWLSNEAMEILRKRDDASVQDIEAKRQAWLGEWAGAWSHWGYRFASVRYEQALKDAKGKAGVRPFGSAGAAVSSLVESLRSFLLGYLPNSGLAELVRGRKPNNGYGWLLPEEVLDVSLRSDSRTFRDDYWDRCCADQAVPANTKLRTQSRNMIGAKRSHDVQCFLDFIAESLNERVGDAGRFETPFLPRTVSGALLARVGQRAGSGAEAEVLGPKSSYEAPIPRMSDKSCSWISRDYPHLHAWEPFAREYIKDTKKNVTAALNGLSIFFDRYLANAGKMGTPGEHLDPLCALRPVSNEQGSDALLLVDCKSRVPRNLDTLSAASTRSASRAVRDGFIPHILRHHCSLVDSDRVTLLPLYWNPFANVKLEDDRGSTRTETSRGAMPYRWVRRLRSMLVQGPHFCDWTWAQQAQHHERGQGADWFEVDESVIDRSDPDCVWRQRTVSTSKGSFRTFYELWSPVRWVSLVTKLCTALRTMQVRALDSGESDAWRFDLRQWSDQTYQKDFDARTEASATRAVSPMAPPGASGSPWVINDLQRTNPTLFASVSAQDALRKRGGKVDPQGWVNGVLRPKWVHEEDGCQRRLMSLLYINTNKTADSKKEGASKGFEVPLPMHACPLPPDEKYWIRQGEKESASQITFATSRQKQDWFDDLSENIHWWLAKLRDWQEKYNPVERRIDWKEMSGTRLMSERSDEQYQMYRPACFLFREPAMSRSKSHPGAAYPLPDSVVMSAWWALLRAFQDHLNSQCEAGQPEIRLVTDDSGNRTRSCVYDLHSIRVSIITALIVEGKVPVQYVQALVGHSRLVMTLYYTKINPLTMALEIAQGFSRASETEVDREKLAIQNASTEELRNKLAFNDPDSALAALGASRPPGKRNMVMWMRKLGGICPVGGVSHDTEGGLTAGCFNGGPLVGGGIGSNARYAPVEGGPGTCVNCRWFVTKIVFIGELQAIAENALYRYHEFKEKTSQQEQEIELIKTKYERMENSQGALNGVQKAQYDLDIGAAEAVRDGYMESAALDVMISGNAYRLIQRLGALQRSSVSSDDTAMITVGTIGDLKVVLSQTDSAMLHAARICLHSEIHPEISAPAATLRAALGIARKLQEEDLDPFSFLSLPEVIQNRAVNAVTKHIASLCSPGDLNTGLSAAVALIESKHKLSDITSTSPLKLKEWISGLADGVTQIPGLATGSPGRRGQRSTGQLENKS